MIIFLFLMAIVFVATIFTIYMASLRRVVRTNEVHIVQRAKKTVSYGVNTSAGNTYYEFPSWMPVLGITKTIMPTSVFDLDLSGYEAYDKDRLPFVVDVKAFFRITDSDTSASRVSSFNELLSQLMGIVQGSVRSILAKEDLKSIMCERNIYGDKFTSEVFEQLKEWGVAPVKNIELMDIRDAKDSHVIANIMEKKKSQIEMESRVTVADNHKKAKEAEILANQEVALKEQESQQQVGLKQATVQQQVGIAEEKSKQLVQEQAKLTAEKEMEVQKVREVQLAEIQKQANTVNAEANKNVTILNAEASKEQQELDADAKLTVAKKNAQGIEVEGKAIAEAEKAKQLAPVEAQIKLAKEIGSNESYQNYLVTLEQIKGMVELGIEQAKNLGNADVKIFANGSNVSDGISSATNIFSTKNGLNVGALLEGLSATECGKGILDTVKSKLGSITE